MQSIPVSDVAVADRPSFARASLRQATVLLGFTLAGLVLAIEWWRYLRLDAYLDHIEGNVVIAGWLLLHGTPLYAIQDGVTQFTGVYGPLGYLAAVPGLLLGGPTIIASKWPGLLAMLATLGLTALRFRRAPPMAAMHGLFFLVAGCAALSPMSFWIRPDPFEMLLVAVGLAVATSPIGVGICIGLAVGFKIHAFLYFLPILFELWTRRGWLAAPPLVACTALTFLAPFLVPGISLHDYLATIARLVGGRAYTGELLAPVFAYAVALALPVLLPLRRQLASSDRRFAVVTLASLALLIYPALIPGAGPYHFLPLLPVLAEARKRLRPIGIGAEFAVFPLLFFAAATTSLCLSQIAERQGWHAYADEALTLARQAPPGSVDIGYGDTKRSYQIAQLAKTELSLNGYPRWVDAQILMELRQSGVDGSRRWIPYLTECRVRRWLIPRGEGPFAMRSYFYDDGLVFDDAFRAAFAAHYRPVGESAHFTIWECDRDPG
jgi:hypothetical protein